MIGLVIIKFIFSDIRCFYRIIYSISGQLLEKKPVQQGETVIILSKKSKGTIGIVKITSVNSLYTGKIMY